VQGPGKSWNFLGYNNDVGGGQNDAGADAEICVYCSHISTDCSVKRILVTAHLYCIIHPGILLFSTA